MEIMVLNRSIPMDSHCNDLLVEMIFYFNSFILNTYSNTSENLSPGPGRKKLLFSLLCNLLNLAAILESTRSPSSGDSKLDSLLDVCCTLCRQYTRLVFELT